MNKDPKKVMHRLAYHYLKIAGIEIAPGASYDANKIAKGLSAIYRECKKDEEETKRRITVAGEYFNQRNLDWTPIAVWRDWELIQTWKKRDADKNNRPIKQINTDFSKYDRIK